MNEDDAVRAALSQYYDSSRPAGYTAAFRAGWDAGRIYEVGICTHEERERVAQQLPDLLRRMGDDLNYWRERAESAEGNLVIAAEETPACQDCGMRHQPDDRAACIEGHGDEDR